MLSHLIRRRFGMAQPNAAPWAEAGSKPNSKLLLFLDLPLLVIVLCLTGCGGSGGGPQSTGSTSTNPEPTVTFTVSVNPSSTTVAVGSSTTFAAFFAPSLPQGGTLSWSVSPATGGTITSSGVYTASGTEGDYTVIATWIPANQATGTTISGSATVKVLAAPQVGAVLNPDLTQASGAIQASSTIQSTAIVGESIPAVNSTDPTGNIKARSGFDIPVQ